MAVNYAALLQWFSNPDNAARFWENWSVGHENGCHLWLGPFWEDGHGRFSMDGSNTRTHRVRYILARESDMFPEAPFVSHLLCKNPACGNPRHLAGGDRKDNAEDEQFVHGVPMGFGPGHDTGGEPGKK